MTINNYINKKWAISKEANVKLEPSTTIYTSSLVNGGQFIIK